jgi:hypothetical protein
LPLKVQSFSPRSHSVLRPVHESAATLIRGLPAKEEAEKSVGALFACVFWDVGKNPKPTTSRPSIMSAWMAETDDDTGKTYYINRLTSETR